MKEFLHRIFSCCMALHLLLSTTSWKVEKHYCMGRLMDFSLFSQVDDCGMDMDFGDNQDSVEQSEDSCCSDETISMQGQDDLLKGFDQISTPQKVFLTAFIYSYISLLTEGETQNRPFDLYPPPLLTKDIHLVNEVFLI